MKRSALSLTVAAAFSVPGLADPGAIPPIPRVLPPENGVLVPPDQLRDLSQRVEDLASRLEEVANDEHAADAGMLVKAVDFALMHGEFYSEKEFPRASEALDLAENRLDAIEGSKKKPWLEERGLVVRGYRSTIDGSYQPYGLEVPPSLDLSKPVPLLVWLHGRGDKATDLHFLHQCRTKSQSFGGFNKDQDDAIVLHPFGRQCVGWKHAGEIDVLEVIKAVSKDYQIDPDRILLAGFSMGGAGAWHIGAHYRDHFCGIHAGAGFAETREYNKLTPDKYPPLHEQTLWKVYDVPEYTPNFLNGPLLAYSGALDKQKAAADLMARELSKVGHELRHLVAPETEHKYTAEAVAEIRGWMQEVWKTGRTRPAPTIVWQTPTLRYASHDWLRLTGLEKHWAPAKAEASWDREAKVITVETQGVTAFEIDLGPDKNLSGSTLHIGGTSLPIGSPGFATNAVSLVRRHGQWQWGEPADGGKRPGLQGPIDDVFLSRFVVVPPDQTPKGEKVARWTEFELDHFRARWRALMRGVLPEKRSDELEEEDLRDANLVLWGDPESNATIAKIAAKLPVIWSGDSFVLRGETYSRGDHVPVLIFPNPLNPARYVVLNSGLTFREGHDRTNSQQNPKLPDWAVVGLDRAPDALAPGRIAAAGFFNEDWK